MPENGVEIQVNETGLVLGWKLFAGLAAAFLGIYIGMVIAPLETQYTHLLKKHEQLSVEVKELQKEVIDLRTHTVIDDTRAGAADERNARIEDYIQKLEAQIGRLQERLNALRRRTP